MSWTRRIVICVIATTFFAILASSAGKFVSVPAHCTVPSDAASRLEALRDCNDSCQLLEDPNNNDDCKGPIRSMLRAQVLADYGLLIAYSALTAALFFGIASKIGTGASLIRALGLLLASGMLVCDAAENFLQLHLLRSSFCPQAVCSVQETFHWLGIFNPAKWWFLVISALVLAMLNLFVFRGVGRVVLAALYLSAAVQGYESLQHPGRGFQGFFFVLSLAWLGSMLQSFGADRLNLWRNGLKDLAVVVKPCRFSLITAVAVVGALSFLPQGHDLVAHLAEWEKNPLQGQIILAFIGLFTLGVICWYTARVALYILFGDTPTTDTPRLAFLRKWVPRWIGVLPFIGMSIANLLVLPFVPGHSSVSYHLKIAALLCILLGAIFLILVMARRSILNRLLPRKAQAPAPEAPPVHASFEHLVKSNTGTLIALLVIAILALALFVALSFAAVSVHVAPVLGAVAVVFLAAAMWLPLGSYLAYLGHHHRFPLLTLLLFFVPLFSLINDNHRVRTLEIKAPQKSIREELVSWVGVLDQKEPQEKKHPLVIVATEGGGIRAAYWTASVLAALQDDNPAFARHVFAISSVSGGSLGAGVFSALVADAVRGEQLQGKFAERARKILGEDLLSSDLGALLSGEFLQRFLPFPVLAWDRSLALESSWEQAYRKGPSTLTRPFTGLWSDYSSDWVPRLALNSTWVETGRRVIITPFTTESPQCSSLFVDSVVLPAESRNDFPLSSAIHNSARFPYVSPPGRLDGVGIKGGHVVDGGLFDNSGASTALEIIACVQKEISADLMLKDKVGPILVVGIVSNPEEADKTIPPTNILADALASPEALWNARDARASFAVASLRGLTLKLNENTGPNAMSIGAPTLSSETTAGKNPNENFFQFGLSDKEGKKKLLIPLGWQLSELAKMAIERQLEKSKPERNRLKTRILTPPQK